MTYLEQLIDLNSQVTSIMDAEYGPQGEGRPLELIEVLTSVYFMSRYCVRYELAKSQKEGALIRYDAAAEFKRFAKAKVELLKRLDSAIDKPQVFKEHNCAQKILDILVQMRQVAPDASIEEVPAPILHSHAAAGKSKSGSISSDGSTTDTGTPASQQFEKAPSHRPPSPNSL